MRSWARPRRASRFEGRYSLSRAGDSLVGSFGSGDGSPPSAGLPSPPSSGGLPSGPDPSPSADAVAPTPTGSRFLAGFFFGFTSFILRGRSSSSPAEGSRST